MLDSSFLISLSDDSREDHHTAKQYFYAFIERGVMMHLSTIVICEYEVRQRIADLGLHNFLIKPFNFDDAAAGALAFSRMHENRAGDDERTAVSADAKIIGQCITAGIHYFITGDEKCCRRIESLIRQGGRVPFPAPISIKRSFDTSWFNRGQHEIPFPE